MSEDETGRHELSDGDWSVIEPLLPRKWRGVARVDDRRVLNGILWRFRTGSPWRDVPRRYGPYTTCYNRFVRWERSGVWDGLLKAVSAAHDGDIVMIDSSCVRVHQHGANGKRMARPVGKWFLGSSLICLHKRIRPSGEPLAKMESRASWSR